MDEAGVLRDPLLLVDDLAAMARPWLIGVDVDGTLAPIVARPEDAALAPGALDALESLIASIGVSVAVVSGRPLTDLRHRFGLPSGALLLGSHGAEVGNEAGNEIDERSDDERVRIAAAEATLTEVVAHHPGAWIERKPLAIALHVRQLDNDTGERLLAELHESLSETPGITLHRGHKVLELAIRPTTKRTAFAMLRARLQPATAFFIGDDSSDEHVFASLGAHDVAIKVGQGETVATHRLADPTVVVAFLAALGDRVSTAVR